MKIATVAGMLVAFACASASAGAATLAKVYNYTVGDITVNGSKVSPRAYDYARMETVINGPDEKTIAKLRDRSVKCELPGARTGVFGNTGWLIEGTEKDPGPFGGSRSVNICLETAKLFESYCIKVQVRQANAESVPFLTLTQLNEEECGRARFYNSVHGR